MRKLLELVAIMVLGVGIASGSRIMIISDTGYWPQGAGYEAFRDVDGKEAYQDSEMVDFLKSLGYDVDTSGMAGAYRESTNWTTDSEKVAALNAADLIIFSRKAASGSYDNDRKAWNELAVPILCQNNNMIVASGNKWGWCTGSVPSTAQSTSVTEMPIVMGHEFVDGFSSPVSLFGAAISDPLQALRNPTTASVWDSRVSIIGTYDGTPMLVDIPAGTDFDALNERETPFFGISGARRVYLGIYVYDKADAGSTWGANLTNDYKALFAQTVAMAMSPVRIFNDSPAHNATGIPVDLEASENDLVFTVAPEIVSVDVFLGLENEPNLTAKPQYKIADGLAVTPGQNTIDLTGELVQDLLHEKTYYWRVIGYGSGFSSVGPVWKFATEAIGPVISGVSPSRIAVLPGETVVFTVSGENIEAYQWYKDGNPPVALQDAEGVYAGADSNSLTIFDAQSDDEGVYYCVGMKAGYPSVTSVPSGRLEFKKLMHHFPFDSASGDITVDIIDGVQARLMGGASVVTEPDSIIGGYLQLDNPGDKETDTQYVEILDSAVADYPEITISAWFRQNSRDIGPIWDFGKDVNNYFTFTPGYKDGVAKLEFRYQVGGNQYQDENEVNYNKTGDWQFVTVTLNSAGQSKVYIDGEFKGSDSSEINLTGISKTSNFIGKRIYPNLPMFDGVIDELKIYNYVLTDLQIAREYTSVVDGYVCSEGYNLAAYDYDHDCRVDLDDLAQFFTRWLDEQRIYRP